MSNFVLHPLVLLSASEHDTRLRARELSNNSNSNASGSQDRSVQTGAVGLLLGRTEGEAVHILSTLEGIQTQDGFGTRDN
jgi:arginine utilization protein RocB